MKLLIVDDSMVIRNKIDRAITGRFSEIHFADNGLNAINIAREMRPDVITMDLTMPLLDGTQSIQEIKQFHPTCHILVISALADRATAIDALKFGANGFLCKPFTEAELNSALEKILRIRL